MLVRAFLGAESQLDDRAFRYLQSLEPGHLLSVIEEGLIDVDARTRNPNAVLMARIKRVRATPPRDIGMEYAALYGLSEDDAYQFSEMPAEEQIRYYFNDPTVQLRGHAS